MKHTAIEWLSNQAYELFEQYSEGKFDRIQLNKLMVDATNKAKKMEKEYVKDLQEQIALKDAAYSELANRYSHLLLKLNKQD